MTTTPPSPDDRDRRWIEALRQADEPDPPDGDRFVREVLARWDGSAASEPVSPRRWRLLLFPAALAAVIALAVSISLWRVPPQPAPPAPVADLFRQATEQILVQPGRVSDAISTATQWLDAHRLIDLLPAQRLPDPARFVEPIDHETPDAT